MLDTPLRPVFPFTALVGQERMKRALVLNTVNPKLGGVLVRGEKGTAKSTAVRGLANLLPEISAVSDCPYGCDPSDFGACCESCHTRRGGTDSSAATSERWRLPIHRPRICVHAWCARVCSSALALVQSSLTPRGKKPGGLNFRRCCGSRLRRRL